MDSGAWILVICLVAATLGLLGSIRRVFDALNGIGDIVAIAFFLALAVLSAAIQFWPLALVSGGMVVLCAIGAGRHDVARAAHPQAAKAEDDAIYHSAARELIAVATPLMIVAIVVMVVLAVGQSSGQIDVTGALNSPVGR